MINTLLSPSGTTAWYTHVLHTQYTVLLWEIIHQNTVRIIFLFFDHLSDQLTSFYVFCTHFLETPPPRYHDDTKRMAAAEMK